MESYLWIRGSLRGALLISIDSCTRRMRFNRPFDEVVFSRISKEDATWLDRPFDEVVFSRISKEDATWLDRPFDEEEVFGVVHDFNGDKALGLDGFTMTFFLVLLVHGENKYYECVS